MHRHRGRTPHRSGARQPRRPSSGRRRCALIGTLRYVDGGGRWAALRISRASSVARRLVGTTVTLDLSDARLDVEDRNHDGRLTTRDLLPGDEVRVTTRLTRVPRERPGILRVGRLTGSGGPAPA